MKFLPLFNTVKIVLIPLTSSCIVRTCQYSFWNAVTFGAAKFQVDVKEWGGGEGGLT